MARINIEDSIYQDPRFTDLAIKTGSLDMAIGCLVRAWSLGQAWFLNEETGGRIPQAEWKKHRINDHVIEVGLAEVSDGFIQIKGALDQFGWLVSKRENGLKGGRPKKEEIKSDSFSDKPTGLNNNENKPTGLKTVGKKSYENPLSLSPSLTQNKNNKNNLYSGSLRVDEIIQAFNERLPGQKVGRIPFCKGLNRKESEQFFITASHPEFSNLAAWENLFDLVAISPVLKGEIQKATWVCTLGWLTNYDNAKKVENGHYPPEFKDEGNKEGVEWS